MKPWFEKELVTELKEPVQYKGFDISVSKTKVKPPYIAVITSQATHKELSRTGGDTEEEALDSAKQAIDKREADAPNISAGGSTSVLMNTASNDELLKDPSMYNHIYAKISNDKNGPTLVIGQGEEDGFVRSYDRRRKSDSEEALPQVMFNAKNEFLSQAGIKMNGRYSLDLNGKYEDENKHTVYPLQFQGSTVHSGDKLRMGKPGLTIGATREDIQPWFEKELTDADIIKFPEPEAKVAQMPNVQEYPDFITGVQDLQAKQKDGAISQESYDKLYAELIHRFMKKESFETPWFIREADLTKVSPSSKPKYLGAVNDLLLKNNPIAVGKTGDKMLVPDPGQKITDLKFGDIITGKIDGEPIQIKANQIYKGPELKGDRKYWNLGYVSEGLFGMGIFLALLNESPVGPSDIQTGIMKYLKSNGDKINARNKETSDKISLQVYLPGNDFKGLKDPETYKNPDIQNHNSSIANYVNNSSDFKSIDQMFSTNKKIDSIEVIADGRSEQKATTVDVYIKYADGKKVKFERSIKSGQVRQFGQAPMGGALRHKEKDDATYSREDRWDWQEKFWNRVGVDISNAEDDFMDTPELKDAFFASFKEAAIVMDTELVGDKKERIMLRNLFRLAQDFAGAKMVHIYKGGYRVMDFEKLDEIVETSDFRADLVGKTYPRLVVKDVNVKGNKGIFLEIQVKTDGNKALFEVDMGPLLKELTTVDKRDN